MINKENTRAQEEESDFQRWERDQYLEQSNSNNNSFLDYLEMDDEEFDNVTGSNQSDDKANQEQIDEDENNNIDNWLVQNIASVIKSNNNFENPKQIAQALDRAKA